jgi:hypothetical protein
MTTKKLRSEMATKSALRNDNKSCALKWQQKVRCGMTATNG